jgi:hypothetical protein
MTDPEKPAEPEEMDEQTPPSHPDPMSALLKRSLDVPAPAAEQSILRGVQRRIRKRSRGKFFADGWSTSDARVSHALIAAAMLLIVLVAYFALGPTGVQ